MTDHYDIATKILLDNCRDELIRRFLNLDIAESEPVTQLPQETVSARRSDYPVLVTDRKGVRRLILVEIQTWWHKRVPPRLLEYRFRYLLQFDVEVICLVILLRPSAAARDTYRDNEVSFQFQLVNIHDMDAREVVANGPLCLLPFTPLMQHGPEELDRADRLIHDSDRPRLVKADMLTSMSILAGLVSDALPAQLIARRRDVMKESAAYNLIKEDGFQEGIEKGIEKDERKAARLAAGRGFWPPPDLCWKRNLGPMGAGCLISLAISSAWKHWKPLPA